MHWPLTTTCTEAKKWLEKKTDLSGSQNDVLMYAHGSRCEIVLFTEEDTAAAQLFNSLCCHFGASDTITDQSGEFIQ